MQATQGGGSQDGTPKTQFLKGRYEWLDFFLDWLQYLPIFLTQPFRLLQSYKLENLRPDLFAGLTVAFVMLPQAIAFAVVAELPPEVGLYTAIVGSIAGALWGASWHLHTGPTNTTSLLVLSSMSAVIGPENPAYVATAATLALFVGIIRVILGLVRFGSLASFVSDSVIVGFSTGAAVLIAGNQLRHLLRLEIETSPFFLTTLLNIIEAIGETHRLSLALGVGTMLIVLALRQTKMNLPNPLIGIVVVSAIVAIFRLDQEDVRVLGEIPRTLPPFQLPMFDWLVIQELIVGVFAISVIGLIEATSISQTIAVDSDQRIDADQEFFGQGMANIAAGLFGGYPGSGSFTRSALNFEQGAKTQMAAIFSGVFVLIFLLLFAPLAAFIPRTALAGIIIGIAIRMIKPGELRRIWRGSKPDAVVMIVTLLATLLFKLEFAVMTGVFASFVMFIRRTAHPRVLSVVPDADNLRLRLRPNMPECPQLAVVTISGALYFGAVEHIEEELRQKLLDHPSQRFLLLRLHRVHYLDISAINMLRSLVKFYREHDGDVYISAIQPRHMPFLKDSGFINWLGRDHVLPRESAISHMFYEVLEPAYCKTICPHFVWNECSERPKTPILPI